MMDRTNKKRKKARKERGKEVGKKETEGKQGEMRKTKRDRGRVED